MTNLYKLQKKSSHRCVAASFFENENEKYYGLALANMLDYKCIIFK